MYQKALILSASVGAGHLRAAQALEMTFREMNAAREIKNIDVLDYTNEFFRTLYSKAYLELVGKAPHLLGLLYDKMDTPFKNEKLVRALNKLNTRPFVKFLEDYQPELLVCTHFLPSEIISRLKEKGKIHYPQTIIVTDLDVSAMWMCRNYEHYFVAIPESREVMMKWGVPKEKITVSGIPIDPVFSKNKDKIQMREKHGLDPHRTTILISAGGFGVGPIEDLISALLEIQNPVQIITVCGKNPELKARIEKQIRNTPSSVKTHVLGFTREMDELMSASDLLVGKPGGLTTSEALAKGLVLVIVNPIPGQEERNSDHYLEEGVAIRCNNLPVVAYKIDTLLNQPQRFAAMKKRVQEFARPHAAYDIVRKLVEIKTETPAPASAESNLKKKIRSFSFRR